MSQHWHGHWTESAFTPKKLRNWEVPKWYPSWPDRHCITTKFIAYDNGHIIDKTKKIKQSQCEIYKNTWDLPKKITRSIAEELSAIPQYKKDIWELHKKKHQNLCKKIDLCKKKKMKYAKSLKELAKEKKTETTKFPKEVVRKIKMEIIKPSKKTMKKDQMDNIQTYCIKEDGKNRNSKSRDDFASSFVPCESK